MNLICRLLITIEFKWDIKANTADNTDNCSSEKSESIKLDIDPRKTWLSQYQLILFGNVHLGSIRQTVNLFRHVPFVSEKDVVIAVASAALSLHSNVFPLQAH